MRTVVLVVALSLGMAAGVALAEDISPENYLAMILQQDHMLTTGTVGPILEHPGLTQDDKDLVNKALKPVDDAIATLKQNAKAKSSMEGIQADQRKVVQSTLPMMKLISGRKDFTWISQHGKYLIEKKGRMLMDRSADLLNLVRSAGADEKHLANAKAIVDKFKADYDQWKQASQAAGKEDPTKQMSIAVTLSEKGSAAIKGIDAVLSQEQRFAFDWGIGKAMSDDDEPIFRKLGYAAQPRMMRAPEAGTYLLKSETADALHPKELASVALKKDDAIGFKKTDKGTTAAAGDKTVDVPLEAIGEVYWEFSPGKP